MLSELLCNEKPTLFVEVHNVHDIYFSEEQ